MGLIRDFNRRRYAIAIASTILAMILRVAAGHWFAATSPFLFFMPAVMFAAWYGGLGPGIVATAVGAVLANYFLIPPVGTFALGFDELSRVALFIAVGIQISWLSGQMKAARQRAEHDAAAARRSEHLYRTLASNFPDGFVGLFDNELRWTLVAGAGLAAAGLSRDRMEGQKVGETLPAHAQGGLEDLCRKTLQGVPAKSEITQAGRVYFCHALPLPLEGRGVPMGMMILEDITDRVEARESLRAANETLESRVRERTAELHFQKTLLESQSQASAEGILAVGNDSHVIFANRQFLTMWQITPNHPRDLQAIRHTMREQTDTPQDPLAAERIASTVRHEQPDEILLKDGKTFECYSAPIVDPEGTSFGRVWFYRDVTEQKRLQRQILDAAERERQRIGQDLHDDLCQQLSGISCLARTLEQQLAEESVQASNAAGEIATMVQHANQRARDLSKGLQPVNLLRQGLAISLQELCGSVQEVFHLSCKFRGSDVIPGLDPDVSIQLYRIAQEAVNNAVRHGHAKNIRVDLLPLGGRILLTIEDDGIGIPIPLPETGLGLYTMSYRARLMGGTLSVEPQKPSGTIVTCSIPAILRLEPSSPKI